jgi:F0F1-type ATP synthase membrane subunit b/b'
MELLELFTKAIAPQLLTRIFDNIPQYIIFFGFIAFFIFKYLLKWNKARVEKIKAKEERSNQIWEDGKSTKEGVKEIRAELKQDRIDTNKKFQEIVENFDKKFELTNDKIGAIDKRVIVIETENKINSKQEGTIITMLNRIFNSIEKK